MTTPTAAMLAASLRKTFAEFDDELAHVAYDGSVSRETVKAVAVLAASAVELLAAMPLSPWWAGYVARLGDDVERILSIGDEASLASETEAPW